MTVGELLENATSVLEDNHVPSARLTAEVLLAHCLDRERAFLYTHPEQAVANQPIRTFISMVQRRSQREPLQYITGVQEFYGRPFSVNRDVLIPRPETELIVDAVLELNRWPAPRILDVGTGSGCIASTLALELPQATVYASDISSGALETARRNSRDNGAAVHLARIDLMEGWDAGFEFIVSNPPYVSATEREGLQPEVRDFEPAVALFGDLDPVPLYEKLLSEASTSLVPEGYLILEIGYTVEEPIRNLFGSDWTGLDTRSDLQGFPRVVIACRGKGSSSMQGRG